MREADWQGQFLDLAHLMGWRTMHVRRSIGKNQMWTTTTSVIGWPDIVLWNETQHRIIFAELKSETGKLTSEQVEVLQSLARAGQETYVWRPSDFDDIREVLSP